MSRNSLIIIAVAAVLAVVVGGVVLASAGQDHAVAEFNADGVVSDGYTTTAGGVTHADPGRSYLVVTYTVKAVDGLTNIGGTQDCYLDVTHDGVTTRYTASAWDTSRFWAAKEPVSFMEPGSVHSFAMVFYLPDEVLDGTFYMGFGKNIKTDLDRELPVTTWSPFKPA